MPRFLSMIRADEQSLPAGPPTDAEFGAKMGALLEEVTKAGVMLDTAGLKPSAEGTRVTWSGGRLSFRDGPFTESKEVIGGYAVFQVKDKAEALEWTKRFLEIHPEHWTLTCEVREIEEAPMPDA
jgi:hypothetical protein